MGMWTDLKEKVPRLESRNYAETMWDWQEDGMSKNLLLS